MGRLKKLKFNNEEELEDYYDENRLEIYIRTLDIMEKCFNKTQSTKTVDIFELEIPTNPLMKFISILEDEWGLAFDEMVGYAEEVENYEFAARVRDINNKIFGYEEEE